MTGIDHTLACSTCFGVGVLEVMEGTRIHDRACHACHGSGWADDNDEEDE